MASSSRRLVVQLQRLFGCNPEASIARLEITARQRVISRADVERAIVEEEAMLEQVATLLERRAALSSWPQDARTALALALAFEDGSLARAEGWKAVALRRHLFGPEAAVPDGLAEPGAPSALDRRHAERLRSGLLARVRYRIAMYLLRA